MVSPLSARLIAGYSSEKSFSDGSGTSLNALANANNDTALPISQGGNSGYSADVETTRNAEFPPCMIGMLSRKAKREALSRDKEAKRQRTAEDNYNASTVKSDLEKVGKGVPELRADCPRTLPTLSGVGMSHVSHVFSKDFHPEETIPSGEPHDYYFGISQLGEACRSFYNVIPQEASESMEDDEKGQNSSYEGASTTSSVTNESEDPLTTISRGSASSERDPSLVAMGDSLSIGLLPLGSKGERSVGSEAK